MATPTPQEIDEQRYTIYKANDGLYHARRPDGDDMYSVPGRPITRTNVVEFVGYLDELSIPYRITDAMADFDTVADALNKVRLYRFYEVAQCVCDLLAAERERCAQAIEKAPTWAEEDSYLAQTDMRARCAEIVRKRGAAS